MKNFLLTHIIVLIASFTINAQQTGFSSSTISWSNQNGAQARGIKLYVPLNYNPNTAYGLIIGLHGQGDNPANYVNTLAFVYINKLGLSNVILVAPDMNDPNNNNDDWDDNNDMNGIIAAIKTKINQTYNLNLNKTYLQGFSIGGKIAFFQGLKDANELKGIMLSSPAISGYNDIDNTGTNICDKHYEYQNAPYVRMCFSAGPSEINSTPGCAANGNFYNLAQAASLEVNNNGGHSIFYNNSRNTHSIDTNVVNLQTCWNHINNPVAVINNDAGITIINTPSGKVCTTTITLKVTLKNFGLANLTAVTINYSVDGLGQSPYAWTGNLASNGTATVNLPTITATNGSHTFNANTTMPNGVTDQILANNAAPQTNFTVVGNGLSLPFNEGFEGAYLPSGWSANNPDGNITWAKTALASKSGNASAFMDFTNYNSGTAKDDIITPALDLTSVTNPQLSFEVAYSLYTNPNSSPSYSDTLQVLVSTDCGTTWTSVYKKFGTALVTATPAFTTAQFVPTANQWRTETVNLATYASSSKVMVMFRGINNYENSLYLDDISINGQVNTSVEKITSNDTISIFPNPATEVINVLFMNVQDIQEITIINAVGQVIYTNTSVMSRINTIDMSSQAKGIYIVKVKIGNQITTKKIILTN